jgi:hypothetical protein
MYEDYWDRNTFISKHFRYRDKLLIWVKEHADDLIAKQVNLCETLPAGFVLLGCCRDSWA